MKKINRHILNLLYQLFTEHKGDIRSLFPPLKSPIPMFVLGDISGWIEEMSEYIDDEEIKQQCLKRIEDLDEEWETLTGWKDIGAK